MLSCSASIGSTRRNTPASSPGGISDGLLGRGQRVQPNRRGLSNRAGPAVNDRTDPERAH